MKICTIIAEFNPLHKGHKRLIDFAKTLADTVVIVMSGNFTQRGLPAVCSKQQRAKHAILAGADMAIELPTIFATASAQNFATAGVKIANQIASDYLLFGSECGNIDILCNCAKTMLTCQENNTAVKTMLDQGLSYPNAIAQAFSQYEQILSKPNNMLAIEYLKAIYATNSKVIPATLQRDTNYNSQSEQSSKAIRYAIANNNVSNDTFDFVLNDCSLVAEQNYKQYVASAISTMSTTYLSTIEGVTEGIENRIYKFATCGSYDDLVANVKSKRYTQLKIQRILTNACLGITKKHVEIAKDLPVPVKVLALSKDREDLLSYLSTTQQVVNPTADNITHLADRLYQACSNQQSPKALLKV